MELTKYNRLELSELEMHEISGGNWWSDFVTGFSEGYNWASGVILDAVSLIGKLRLLAK
jgi:hypothetical protein